MQKIIIDEQFRFLLPGLSEADYQKLEASLLEYGCVMPLVLWKGILIDGYHRYKICSEFEIPFKTLDMEFESREEATIWIIDNQIHRRNLTAIQLCYFRGLHYHMEKQLAGGDRKSERQKSLSQNETMISGGTAGTLSDTYNVSRSTIIRDEKLAISLNRMNEILPEAKWKVLTEEVPINKSKLEALHSAPVEDIKAVVSEIVDGTYNRKATSTAKREEMNEIIASFPEVQKLNSIINSFAKDISAVVRNISNVGPSELRSTLRTYINELEELYKNLGS